MSIQTTLPEPNRLPKIDRPERQVVFTANGSRKAAETIYRTGALVGMESLNTRPPEFIPVEFVDWPFTKLADHDFDDLLRRHLQVVADEQPRLAVAPDIDGTLPAEDVYSFADELARYAETVIVVPKMVLPTDVPRRFRVGMPCQDRFGGTPWRWNQYRACEEVHLLGGSPSIHREILKYYVPVESVDTVAPLKAASFGNYWDGRKWCETGPDVGYYWRVERSYSNMRYMMNERREVWDPRARNRKLDWEQAFWEYCPDADCFDAAPPVPRYTDEVPEWLPADIV